MPYPEFFDAAPRITVRALARLPGAANDGVIEYSYTDAVKLAGHSCPTVASAYLMTRAAFGALYPNALPARGGIRVELRNDRLEGATGVGAKVASFPTGATYDAGFKGIGGHFDRRQPVVFRNDIPAQLRFTRTDTGAAVTVSARLDRVPADPGMVPLLQRCLAGTATADEASSLLVEHADDPDIIVVQH